MRCTCGETITDISEKSNNRLMLRNISHTCVFTILYLYCNANVKIIN